MHTADGTHSWQGGARSHLLCEGDEGRSNEKMQMGWKVEGVEGGARPPAVTDELTRRK